ncbi:MAG: OadG family protein [Candidatus Sumerlaeia bacterium]|nr:OadG family protein [Candidatus Sumerlaeia bacterium]
MNPLKLLAQAPGNTVWDGVMLTVLGMGIVFTALSLIWFGLEILGRLTRIEKKVDAVAKGAKAAVQKAETAAAAPAAAAEADGPSPELIAVIIAAATAAVGAPIRLRKVTYVNPTTAHAWSDSGRRAIHTSHRPQREPR